MKLYALDTEVTTYNKGDPFDTRNKFVLGGWYDGVSYSLYNESSFHDGFLSLGSTQKRFILFNAKFDLHWLRNIKCVLDNLSTIWDCQLAEFILSNQKWKYPSLEESCLKRGLGSKIDVIKKKYWDNGINTDEIPIEELSDYLKQDLSLTYQLYLKQLEEFQKPEHRDKYKLFRIQCQDLIVLAEMEYNGYKYDEEASLNEAKLLEKKSSELDNNILAMFDNVPLNLGSPDHISCMLYGGEIKVDSHVPVGVYKTGAKVGHTRYKIVSQVYKLPRLIEPLKGSELAKDGYFSTNEDTLSNLRATGAVKIIINSLLERRGLEKLRSTYLEGIPKLIKEHSWADSIVHGSLNQCVTITGRLSATKPNQQNMTKEVKDFCISRYN